MRGGLGESAGATPDMMREAIGKLVGSSPVNEGRVTLDIPPLVENGNTVPLTVSVDARREGGEEEGGGGGEGGGGEGC